MLHLPEKQQEVVKAENKSERKINNWIKGKRFKTIPFLHITTQTMKHTKSSVLFLVQPWQ